uniref:FAD-dependent oxidoreductase n=1 Tax=Acrobeloides nanus TaxID=290746 RepID=A0A914D906_9BILA
MSKRTREAQRQLNYALIMQSISPLITVFLPTTITGTCLLLRLETSGIGILIMCAVGWITAINPTSAILFVAPYRQAFLSSGYYLLTLLLLYTTSLTTAQTTKNYDVVVYGATGSGVIAAVTAARGGVHVALVEPKRHIGGMVSGGLSTTDIGNASVIGGYVQEIYRRGAAYYNIDFTWYLEPHIAEKVFNDMVNEAGVEVFYNSRLKEQNGVMKQGGKIVSITTENNVTFQAKVFIDATYEGDLMAFAGVSYIVGREGQSQYGESRAGIRK